MIDVSNPDNPAEVGHCTPMYAYGVALAGGHAYVADGCPWLSVVDVSDPAAPVEVGFYYTLGESRGVAVVGDYAYVAALGLRVVDVSNPAAPVEVGFTDTAGYALSVAVAGGYAYVTNMGLKPGLRVVDVSDPENPVEVGFTGGWPYGVAVAGDYAYVADGYFGLSVVDVSQPAAPVEVGYYDTPGEARGVAVAGDYAYLAASYGGLVVLRFEPTYSISGRVTDAGDQGLPGVIVSAGPGAFAVTDGNGDYVITNMISGTYTLTPVLNCYSFDPVTRTVDVPPDATGQDFRGEAVACFRVHLPMVLGNQ